MFHNHIGAFRRKADYTNVRCSLYSERIAGRR